ncbi:MAG: aldehyde ferredoxin oxidoreductase, partial [Deltaproteobacteria bacterium]
NLGVLNNPAFLLKTNFLCNRLGMDTISVSGTLATAMELFEKGFLPEEDAGYKLNFGNAEAVIELITKTAMREGFGDVLAEGGYRLAEKYGHPEIFMGVKKLEFPAYDVRSAHGMGVQTATSTRGACHCRGYTIAPEILGLPEKVDQLSEKGKGALAKHMQDMTAGVIDASGICLFSILGQTPATMVAQLEAATGVGYTLENVEKAGERIWNLQHIFNRRAGFTRKDDTIPRRFREEPAPGGPGKGTVVDIEAMLNEYYKERGWDEEGNPTPEKLSELGLEELKDYI